MRTSSRLLRNCPHPDCPSHAPGSRPQVVRHSRFQTKRGARQRMLCKVCGRTFVSTLGTPYYRLRKPHRQFDQVVGLQAEGLPQAGIARSQRMTPSTVSRWVERAAAHARAFEAEHVEVDDPVEVQMDELKAYGAGRYELTWVYNALEVSSRMWLATQVGPRTLRNTRLFVTAVRDACRPGLVPPLVTSDEFKYYEQVMRRAFGPTAVYVQVDNRYRGNRIVRTKARLVLGTEWRYEAAARRLEDSSRPNTAFIERLNLLMRHACSYLRRRTPAPMRKPQKLTNAIDILRCFYNFIRPHSALRFGKVTRTPAMQAKIFSRPLTFREIFRWVPPPRPGYKRAKLQWGW